MHRVNSWSSGDIEREIDLQKVPLEFHETAMYLYDSDLDLSCPKCHDNVEPTDFAVQMTCSERFFHAECARAEYCEEAQQTCLFCGETMAPDHIESKFSAEDSKSKKKTQVDNKIY